MLLIGTILSTVGDLSGLAFFNQIGTFAKSVAGPAMAIAIGYALHTPPLVLFSLAAVGFAANDAGGAGGPLAVLVVAVVASELGKAVSKETKVDIIVTPAVTILGGCGLALMAAPVSYTHLDVYKRQPPGRFLGQHVIADCRSRASQGALLRRRACMLIDEAIC